MKIWWALIYRNLQWVFLGEAHNLEGAVSIFEAMPEYDPGCFYYDSEEMKGMIDSLESELSKLV